MKIFSSQKQTSHHQLIVKKYTEQFTKDEPSLSAQQELHDSDFVRYGIQYNIY